MCDFIKLVFHLILCRNKFFLGAIICVFICAVNYSYMFSDYTKTR